ncbi:MAG: type VI secretion system tube protein TssD [Melioribacteraceae bacterium]
MSVKGEIFITANGSEIEGPRDNNSSLIFEFNHKIHKPLEAGSGAITGHTEYSPFSVVKDIDQMTPQLYQSAEHNSLCEILIKLYRIGKDTGEEEEYLNYSLKNATIVSIQNWMPSTKIEENDGIGSLERVEILSQVFIVTYLDGGIEFERNSYDFSDSE